MTDIREQLIEKVQAALAQPPAALPGPGVAESLRELSRIAAQFLEGEDAVPAAIAEDVRALAEGSTAFLASAAFREALNRLQMVLTSPLEESDLDALANELADDPELVQEFLVEAREHLANVETALLVLEKDPEHLETLHSVFRSFHTIKGLAGFLGAHSVQELAHETESVLDLVRSGTLPLSAELTDLILQSADGLTRMLDRIGEMKISALPRADETLLHGLVQYSRQEYVEVSEQALPPALGTEPETQQVPKQTLPSARQPAAGKQQEPGVVRVDTAKLEYLIDMVGELVIAESVVRNDPAVARADDPALSRNLAQLARVIEEVQKTSMSMRMVPVGVLFRKMTRLVRDLSRKSGKQVELVTIGEDVELDRTIVEELADPMIHMIRNAVDHGLEPPAERREAGKTENGIVQLKAQHDAGDIVIEISDDGRGLAKDRILSKARRLGLVGEDQTPDEAEIFRMIFEPGFSTASKVTDMSGRGVGMDVVKRHIQKLRGRIDIRSAQGAGCTFTLRLPLTLAIIDGLVVSVGSQRYILPMFAVREMFSPTPETFVTIENRAEAALFRDRLMPVVRLSTTLQVADANRNPGILIVAEARDQLFCIAVDQLIGKQEVVIKSLGKTLRDVPAIAGGAILGDGRVGLILDVNALR